MLSIFLRRSVLFLATLFLLSVSVFGEALSPKDEILSHRAGEAEMKARLYEGLSRAVNERTPNQDLYDAIYYGLNLDLNPTTRILTGQGTVRATVIGSSISEMDLNLAGLTVSAVTSGGVASSWTHAGDVLTVDLDRVYMNGETVEVTVDYSGNPAGDAFGWDSHAGNDMIWTLSEPYGAREWWPCKDINTDKADSIDIIVTVPNDLIVASNGLLISDVDNGSTRTFHWHSDYAIVTYLVSLAIHPYTQFSDWYTPQAGGDPMEIQHFVFPDHYSDVQTNYAKVPDMMDVFAQGFGEYPFIEEKYGHAEFNWGGGMEHQTMTSLGGWWEDVISHELGHMWWGDMITCADFGHIWLNEGFATWCEAYWKEVSEGFPVYQDYMNYAAYYGDGTIFVEDPSNVWDIFNSNLSYNKGSWVVHMLRNVLGDTDFFAGLAEYRSQYGFDSATTEDLRDVMESVSGLDLDAFFDQWIYGEYFPVYRVNWLDTGGNVELLVEQIQTNTGLFTMPIDVRITSSEGVFEHVIQNSQANENYSLAVSGTVESVELDPDRWILRQVQTSVSNPSFDEGILLVNGVHWDTYSSQIYSAYEDSIFWGDHEISFWDCFNEPSSGYPTNLPEPLGHGAVSGDEIGKYSTVIWVGNNYNGDLSAWMETPIASYLEVGGNVLLMTRRSQSFLEGELSDYLGITWRNTQSTLGNCVADYPGLVDIPFTGNQSWNDVYDTTVGPNSTLLFRDTAGFSGDRGSGVHAQPPGGGLERPEGGNFVHIAGRPYRMNHDALRSNVEFILEHFFLEPWSATSSPSLPSSSAVLHRNWPNPFNPKTRISFTLSEPGPVELSIFDIQGRKLRTLAAGLLAAGSHDFDWDGRDESGTGLSSGLYQARLKSESGRQSRSMLLLR
jgi:hypothetical protein